MLMITTICFDTAFIFHNSDRSIISDMFYMRQRNKKILKL